MAQTLRVGKHKGRSFQEVAADRLYCSWILREKDLSRSLNKFREYLLKEHKGIVTVGKYKRMFFDEVHKEDPDYCAWVSSLQDANFFQEFQIYLNEQNNEESTEPPKKKQAKEADDKCKVCFDRQISCVFVPCGHLVCCLRCGLRCENVSGECPICKQKIALVTQTFTA